MHFVRDPATGKCVSRLNPPDQRTRTAVPQLHVVDQELWEAVLNRLDGIRSKSGAG